MTASTEMVLAGRYRLGPLLGRGGMAEVYEAMDERLARPVAVKLLLAEFAAQAGMRERFEAEARSAARLSHPSVVAVFDSGEDDGTPFIVMERLPGETLADRMGGTPLEVAWLRGMAHDVLGALGAAHAADVVHRDVKPANILIGADGRAKIADFGIAKTLEEVPSDLTGANQLLGTVAYLAPERLDGLPATARSDLYAFGVVLYEALAGVRAFHGTTPLSVAYAVHNADPPPLGEVRPDLRADLVAVVERAMERDPASRYATAAEMAAALGGTDSAAVGTAVADSTVAMAMASPAPESATVVMPIAAGAGTASSNEATAWAKPLWAGGLVARLGRRTMLIALLIAGLVLIGVVALAAGGSDSGRSSGTDFTPTTTVPPQSPTTEVTPTTPTTTAAPAAGPPAGGGSPGKTKGRGKGKG